MRIGTIVSFVGLMGLAGWGCSRPEVAPFEPRTETGTTSSQRILAGFPENFESGTKTTYTTGSATLSTGAWTFNDALIGNTTSDPKTGAQSARVRNVGSVGMSFDLTTGAGTVSVAHARYGADASSNWELWLSTNSGSTFTKVGATQTASSATLQTAIFTVNQTGTVRFELRKTTGGTARLNFDDVNTTAYSGTPPPPVGGKKFLFDASHTEMAGNADWVPDVNSGIASRYPTPAATGITATTSESYWTGAVSAWAVALAKLGNSVETLPAGTAISYGNTANPQDLANYSVFIVDEPNTRFTTTEKTAILQFVQAGGGLFMIADHNQSDRNSDGWDAPNIWNDLMTTNAVQANPFGLSFTLNSIAETSSNVKSGVNPVLNGSQGIVSQLKYSAGATMTTSGTAQPLIWRGSSTQGASNVMCATATFGSGRVVAIGDSSPADDGTGSPGNTLYFGWTELASHSRLHLNASLWLAKQQ
ncbi:MAG: hydrolase [Hymenobacteraceae bacterium]|nr:hydrolase [Hymenobacteraceae bacterium]